MTGTTLFGITEAHEYNDFGEASRQTARNGGTAVFDVQISRDDLGRITQRIEVVDGIARLFQYGYDLAGWLQTVTRDGNLVAHYTYDANGNRLTAEGEAYGGGLPITATYDDQDRLLTYGDATYTYTPNGELSTKTINGQTTAYVYDTLGNLISVTEPNGDVISYTIDGRGRRVGKSINGVRMRGWLYADQLRPIAELDGAGNVISRFVYGTKPNVPDYMIRGGTVYRIFSDHLGSPRVVVNTSSGQIVQRMDFHAFGEVIQDSNSGWQPFGFAGGLTDPDTNLIRFGSRDYNPLAGRWLSRDAARFRGKDSNLYQYVSADPINWRDSDGRVLVPGAVIGSLIGAVSGYSSSRLSGGGDAENAASAILSGIIGGLAGALTGPAGGAFAADVVRGAAIGAAAGFTGNVTGQTLNKPLLCFDAVPALISTLGGALGGAFGSAAIAGAEMMAGAMGPWSTGALESVGASLATVADTIANVVYKGNKR